jgi:hypothetical protein
MEKKMKTYECVRYILAWTQLQKQNYKNSFFHDFFPLTPTTIQYGTTHVLEVEKPLSN